jgi:stage V sporulation protein G
MNVTDVVIRRIVDNNGLKAIVSVTLDQEIVIHNIRIMSKDDRLYVLYPNHRHKDKERGLVYPISRVAQEKLEQAVIAGYTTAKQKLDAKRN